jgi:hypothetical protein
MLLCEWLLEGVQDPLLEYLCCRTWYQSLFEYPLLIVDRDREAKSCLISIFTVIFMYIYGLRGLFHCVWSTRFSQEHFLFHSKRFPFSQDTTITVRSRGIKPEYTFFKFLQSFILVLFQYYLFPGCYSFRYTYALFPAPCAISENQKQIGKGASSR